LMSGGGRGGQDDRRGEKGGEDMRLG
jgi:hypothetical protein